MKHHRVIAIAVASMLLSGCTGQPEPSNARSAIEAAIARSVEATREQDIEAYMAEIPEDFEVRDESGAIITRDQLRANALRDWSVIPKTLAIEVVVDSIHVQGAVATVFTSQRWERLMLQRDGVTSDTVLTTQRHRETWRKASRGWSQYEVEELGGEVFINGERYQPDG